MKNNIREIDALRGIAALVVSFVFHQHYLLGYFHSGPLAAYPVFHQIHEYGWMMVDLFFVISGFIFAHVYLTDNRMNCPPGKFVQARFARLYPLHFVMLIVATSVFVLGSPASVDYARNDPFHFLLNLFMLQESGLNSGMSFNLPAWSISVEVICYVAFYLVATRFHARLEVVAAIIAITSLILTLGPDRTIDHIARGTCGFFAGVLAHRFRGVGPGYLFAACLAGICMLSLSPGFSKGAVLSLTVFPTLVIVAPRFTVLRHAALEWLGDRSYSIYLIHAPLYMAINIIVFAGQKVPAPHIWPTLASAWLLLLLLADLSYRKLECPARRWINSLSFPRLGALRLR